MLRLFVLTIASYTVTCQSLLGFDEWANCRPDEEFRCIQPCPGEHTCRDRDNGILCLAVLQPCLPLCICKDRRLRAVDGSCITNEECDKWKCPGANEHFECGFECDKECATLGTNSTNCAIEAYTCENKCYCDDGYARDEAGNCIPIENCAKLNNNMKSNE